VIIGHYKNLAIIGRIGKYFLIPGHAGVKCNFSCGCADFANGNAFKNCAVLKHKIGGYWIGTHFKGAKVAKFLKRSSQVVQVFFNRPGL
jgi:hypothetical protein